MQPVLAVAWYSEEEWPAWRGSVTDPDKFEDDYSEWKRTAEKTIKELEKQGASVRRAPIRLHSFLRWCAENKRTADASARAAFAREIQKATDDN